MEEYRGSDNRYDIVYIVLGITKSPTIKETERRKYCKGKGR